MIETVSYLILQFREQDTQVHQYRKECADACLSFLLILPNQTKIYKPDLYIVLCVIHANTCFYALKVIYQDLSVHNDVRIFSHTPDLVFADAPSGKKCNRVFM